MDFLFYRDVVLVSCKYQSITRFLKKTDLSVIKYPLIINFLTSSILTLSGSLVCSKKAENSHRRNFGPAMDLPCQGGATTLIISLCIQLMLNMNKSLANLTNIFYKFSSKVNVLVAQR